MTEIKDTLKEVMERIRQTETKRLQVWNTLPCQGKIAQAQACSPSHEKQCEYQQARECPKQILKEQALLHREKRRQALGNGIPERILRKIYDQKAKKTPALQAVQAFLQDQERNILVLSGPNSCGKTTAAAWACLPPKSSAESSSPSKLFVRFVDLESAGRFSELLLRVRKSHLVVLDDIGAAYFSSSGYTSSLLDDVVDAAYQKCHKLILTTDLAIVPNEQNPGKPCFAQLVSKRVMSRIKEAGKIETKLGDRYAE